MCCGRICTCIVCLVAVVIVIGMLFGFGVFKHGFHKLSDSVHVGAYPPTGAACNGRPFLCFPAQPPL